MDPSTTFSQKPFTITFHPPQPRQIPTVPPRRTPHTPTPPILPTRSPHPQPLPPLQFPLQPQPLLLLLSQIPFGSLRRKLGPRLLGLQLIDRLQQALDLVAAFGDVVGELLGLFLAAADLRLEVADGAVVGADGAQGRGVAGFLAFELGLQLGRGG